MRLKNDLFEITNKVFHVFGLVSLPYVNSGKGITIFLSEVTLFTTFVSVYPAVNKKIFNMIFTTGAFQKSSATGEILYIALWICCFLTLKVKNLI